jgi:hypothetical protein
VQKSYFLGLPRFLGCGAGLADSVLAVGVGALAMLDGGLSMLPSVLLLCLRGLPRPLGCTTASSGFAAAFGMGFGSNWGAFSSGSFIFFGLPRFLGGLRFSTGSSAVAEDDDCRPLSMSSSITLSCGVSLRVLSGSRISHSSAVNSSTGSKFSEIIVSNISFNRSFQEL